MNQKITKSLVGFLLIIGLCQGFLMAQEPVHPSLFFKSEDIPGIKKNIENSPWMTQAYKVLIEQANGMMEFGPEANAYMATLDPAYVFGIKGDWKKNGIIGKYLQ